jgi:hypothetical protein
VSKDNVVSLSAAKTLTADELDARIKKRKAEMEVTPCYRCGHSPAAPDGGCLCCQNAHTPDPDGSFKEAA